MSQYAWEIVHQMMLQIPKHFHRLKFIIDRVLYHHMRSYTLNHTKLYKDVNGEDIFRVFPT